MSNKIIQIKNKDGNMYPRPYWPVGSIFISVDSTNPSTYFGGIWESFGKGRVLVGMDTSQTEFNTVMKTGGHKLLQSHTHTGGTSTTGGHNHSMNNMVDTRSGGNQYFAESASFGTTLGGWVRNDNVNTTWNGDHSHSFTTNASGSGNAQNLQPYVVVYMWRRVS